MSKNDELLVNFVIAIQLVLVLCFIGIIGLTTYTIFATYESHVCVTNDSIIPNMPGWECKQLCQNKNMEYTQTYSNNLFWGVCGKTIKTNGVVE